VLGALLVSTTACGGGGSASPTTPLGDQCEDVPDGATRVAIRAADGAQLGGAAVGAPNAPLGVVVVYGASQTLCDWLDEADEIATKAHARVLIVDRRGRGSTSGPVKPTAWAADVVRSGRWLQTHGARRVVVLGSSMGAAIAFAAASPTGPRVAVFPNRPRAEVLDPPCAVVLVSPVTGAEADGGSISALAVRDFRSPTFLVYERDNPQIRSGAVQLAALLRRVGAPPVTQRAIPGTDHSIGLVEKHADVRAFIARAVRTCA
jgi:pimeloyl-ACP methyl ester carboxylesterase